MVCRNICREETETEDRPAADRDIRRGDRSRREQPQEARRDRFEESYPCEYQAGDASYDLSDPARLAHLPLEKRRDSAGIPRVMAENCDVELIDRPDGNQFIARIWRTTQKNELTTQKANEELISTTQKEEEATQKSQNTTQKPLNATQKAILDYLKAHPTATRQEVAESIGNITEDGVKYNIGKLQQYGRLKRENGRKNGSWLVIDLKRETK